MARQSTTPVQFNKSTRKDNCVTMTSGRAGEVVPVGYFPVLPGDSASGRVGIDVQLAEMPKPLLNAVTANFQAWFVPKSAHPKFPGRDELMHAMTGEAIKSLGAADRSPAGYYNNSSVGAVTFSQSALFKTLGIHVPSDARVNYDLVDAYNLVWNFRAAAHSSRIGRRPYGAEDPAAASTLAPAFWPSSRFASVVPDYERALLLGSFDLDVAAGSLSITGDMMRTVSIKAGTAGRKGVLRKKTDGNVATTVAVAATSGELHYSSTPSSPVYYDPVDSLQVDLSGLMVENVGGAGIPVTLADIDKARTTQAFAKLRTAYAGNDATGFDNDDTIVALLMQGLPVPADQFKRPWLLDSKRVPVGFAERFATDAANLDASVTQGRASAQLSINLPMSDVEGVVIITCEVLPERIDERMSDEWLHCLTFDDLPNALRDVQRIEPVDLVLNRRLDAKHTAPSGVYGFEPMNNKWNRDFTRLGGAFYNATPGAGFTENRANIWQTEIVDPEYGETHYIAPQPFPHDVFSDTLAPAFEVVCRHAVTLVGLTQIGDVLAESNDDYAAIEGAGV